MTLLLQSANVQMKPLQVGLLGMGTVGTGTWTDNGMFVDAQVTGDGIRLLPERVRSTGELHEVDVGRLTTFDAPRARTRQLHRRCDLAMGRAGCRHRRRHQQGSEHGTDDEPGPTSWKSESHVRFSPFDCCGH